MSTSEIAKLESRWRDNPQGLTFAPLAEAYRKLKDPRRALEVLVPGLERHPDYIPANIVLGRCHWDLNDLEAAEKAFTHVLALDAENVIALKALADITERQSRPQEAERWLEALLAIDRSNDDAREQLARIRAVQSLSPPIDTPSALVDDSFELAAEAVEPATERGSDFAAEPEPLETEPTESKDIEPEAVEAEAVEPEPIEAEAVRFTPPPSILSDPFPSIADQLANPSEPEAAGEPAGFPDVAESAEPFNAVGDELRRSDELSDSPAPAGFVAEDTRFDAPPPDADGFGFERAEEIVLNVSTRSEFQSPDAAQDLMSAARSAASAPGDESPRDHGVSDAVESATDPVADSEDAAEPAPLDIEPPSPAALFSSYDPDPPATEYAPRAGYQAYEVPSAEPLPAGEPAAAQPAEPDTAEPDLVVTETMAQVFLRQGHVVEALAVYRELGARNPESERLREKVAELEARRVALAAPPPRPSFLARDTGGQSLGSFFSALLTARPSSTRAGSADGLGGVELSPETAPATRPAEGPLSLGSVFGEDPPAVTPAVPPVGAPSDEPPAAAGGAPVSFDDFFAGAQVSTPAPAAPTRPSRVKPDDDLDQFHTWLQGLKR
jgi:tetratricopeptide (TPR) repeat protein